MVMRPAASARLLVGALLMLGLPHPLASDNKTEAAKIIHKVTFVRGGDAGLHCACVTTRSGCDTKLQLPFTPDTVHQWWQTVQVEPATSLDVASACWRKRDVPAHGDALCCSPALNQEGNPVPRDLRNLYGATATREPAVPGETAR
jgi:hypothetical protein